VNLYIIDESYPLLLPPRGETVLKNTPINQKTLAPRQRGSQLFYPNYTKYSPEALSSSENLTKIRHHLGNLGAYDLDTPQNPAMVERILRKNKGNEVLNDPERNFLLHELTEEFLMENGVDYDEAHLEAGKLHPLFANYDPEIIDKYPDYFNSNWRKHWGLQ
jgi:hypothetical protein